MMRQQSIFDISEIHLGIIESNGKRSVLKKDSKSAVTMEDMELTKNWLYFQLKKLNVESIHEVFFASVNEKRELQVSIKDCQKNKNELPPIYN